MIEGPREHALRVLGEWLRQCDGPKPAVLTTEAGYAWFAVASAAWPALIWAALEELGEHSPFGCYDECGHDHDAGEVGVGGVVMVDDVGIVCSEGLLYTICRACHTDDGVVREDSEDGSYPCPTVLRWALATGWEGPPDA